MKQYTKYKTSKFQWIGEVPDHWNEGKIAYYFELGRGRVISELELNPDGVFPVYSSQTINDGCLGFIDTYDFEQDMLTWTTDGANAGTVFLRTGKFNCTNVCGTLIPKANVNLKYYLYYLQNITPFYKRPDTNGAKIMNNEMARIYCLIPSLEEQTKIAQYLDHQTSFVDQLILQKEKLIELLKEKKQAVINEAVTTGLNPKAKMKESGIGWMGEIPESWSISKMKYLGVFINGYAFKSEEFFTEGKLRAIKISNIQHMQFDWSDESFVDEKYLEESLACQVRKNDLVFALTRPIISTGIKASIIDFDEPMVLNQRNAIFRPNSDVILDWIYFTMLSHQFIAQFDSKIDKTGQQPNISTSDISNISITLPTVNEQKEICKSIKNQVNRIDSIQKKVLSAIDKLNEYRQSIIAEAVTGKIDVRDWQPNIKQMA